MALKRYYIYDRKFPCGFNPADGSPDWRNPSDGSGEFDIKKHCNADAINLGIDQYESTLIATHLVIMNKIMPTILQTI